MMKLIELFSDIEYERVRGDLELSASDICYDSRKAEAGHLFVCLRSTINDGHDFAAAAYEKGVRAFLCEEVPDGLADKDDAVIAVTGDTRAALALISARFFDFPAAKLKFVALTGTKGKTTISYMLRSIFEDAGKKVGLIGSNGVMYPRDGQEPFYKKLLNTTPESYVLHGFLKDMADAGVEYVFLEATSQGFLLHRTDGIVFDAALYTNISPDHISVTEHKDFEHYFACKKQIFSQTKICYVNKSMELYDRVVADVPPERIRTYGFEEAANGQKGTVHVSFDYAVRDVRLAQHGTHMAVEFDCKAPTWELPMRVDIPGRFNAENALGAVCIADHFGIPKQAIQSGLARTVVAGRMEYVDVPADYTVLIDFAHNKLSVQAMMETAKQYNPKRIICVFGLEGNRSHIRRFDSGEILGRTADIIILANASPRTDDPVQILADIATGIERVGGSSVTIPDRSEAIRYALSLAEAGDLVLLVGKGNVLYEEVHGVNIPFSEREVVDAYFAERS